jgi:hypothetical protein
MIVPSSSFAVESVIGFTERSLSDLLDELVPGGIFEEKGTHSFRLFDLSVYWGSDSPTSSVGFTFKNYRRGWIDPVPSLTVATVHVFRDSCRDVLQAVRSADLLLGWSGMSPVVQIDNCHGLELEPQSGLSSVPTPRDGAFFFESAMVRWGELLEHLDPEPIDVPWDPFPALPPVERRIGEIHFTE